jgi:hypothetical protein
MSASVASPNLAVRGIMQNKNLAASAEQSWRVTNRRSFLLRGAAMGVGAIGVSHAVLYVHGGVYVISDAFIEAGLASQVSRRRQTKVISVDYRLAPEHRLRQWLMMLFSAYEALLATASALQTSPSREPLAGGGLAICHPCHHRLALPAAAFVLSPFLDAPSRAITHIAISSTYLQSLSAIAVGERALSLIAWTHWGPIRADAEPRPQPRVARSRARRRLLMRRRRHRRRDDGQPLGAHRRGRAAVAGDARRRGRRRVEPRRWPRPPSPATPII